jgi:SAM-dependent methyltransferase
MNNESFQPIAVKSPSANPILFKLRCFIDLQLLTIVDFLRREMTKLPKGSVIDIGAGESPWKAWLPAGCSYRGIDIRHSTEFGMSQRNNEVTLYDGGIMPFDSNSFEGALCIEVLEHAENPDFLLSEIARIMKSDAVLLLTVPWSARRHHIPHDFHRFTKERLQVLLSNAGFTKILVKERGNDYCVIANKLIVNLIRNLSLINLFNFIFKGPLIGITLIFSLVMLTVAHISLLFESENSEDPLGYACKAIKP